MELNCCDLCSGKQCTSALHTISDPYMNSMHTGLTEYKYIHLKMVEHYLLSKSIIFWQQQPFFICTPSGPSIHSCTQNTKKTVRGTMVRSDVCNTWCYCYGSQHQQSIKKKNDIVINAENNIDIGIHAQNLNKLPL